MDTSATARRALADLAAGRDPGTGSVAPDVVRELAEHARAEGLTPALARAIRDGRITAPPSETETVEAEAAVLRRQAGALRLELRRVAEASEKAGLSPAILLKGPAVARRWSDPALRPFGDLDLLVPEDDLGGWRSALEGLGYTGPSPWEEADARRYHHHLVFHRRAAGGSLIVEVHWRLFAARGARDLTYGRLAERAVRSPAAAGLLELDDPAQLLVLAVHLAHHERRARRLVWIRDFVELGSDAAVRAARALAEPLGLGWAMENALAAAEATLGEPRWEARPSEPPAGLPRAREAARGRVAPHLGMLRELGPWRGIRYVLRRFDPRRFRRGSGGFDVERLRSWSSRNLGRRGPERPGER